LQGRVDAKSKTCYFAGDTGYNYDDFRSIGHSWQQIDLSLLPIGAHKPKIFQQPHHLSPEEAVLVHKEIKSKLTVAMHYGTFKLGDDSPWEPIHELLIELNKQQIDSKHFRTLAQGYEINW
jgi:L-ascorbate metabolism protein UlaG (beta-lactamase superfamily)